MPERAGRSFWRPGAFIRVETVEIGRECPTEISSKNDQNQWKSMKIMIFRDFQKKSKVPENIFLSTLSIV